VADEADFATGAQPSLQQLATFLADELFDVQRLRRVEGAMKNAHSEGATIAKAAAYAVIDSLLEYLGKFLFGIEEHVEHIAGPPLARLAGHLLGVDIPVAEIRKNASAGEGSVIGRAVAQLAMKALSGSGGELKPGREGAEKFLGLVGQLIVGGWFEGTAFEMLTTMIPDMDSFESVAELPHELVDALGLGRLGRVALRPFAHLLVATPLTWELNKTYRPTLLSEGLAIREFLAGRWTREQTNEELARQGYSPDRIDALLAAQVKRLSLDDVLLLMRGGTLDRAYALQNLQDEGYDAETAQFAVTAAEIKRAGSIEDNALSAITRAYVDRDLDESQFRTLFPPNIYTADERDAYVAGASIQRGLNVKHLSHGEVIECIELAILPRAFYRDWLTREGYPDEEAFALELRLAAKLDKQVVIETERRRLATERAAEKQARLDAARARPASPRLAG